MGTIRGKVWSAVVAAALMGMSVPCSAGYTVGQAQTTTPATPQSKSQPKKAQTPSQSGTSSAGAGKASGSKTKGASGKAKEGTSGKTPGSKAKGKKGAVRRKHHIVSRKPTAQTIRLTSAFKASELLRPMAQQLAATRSAAAYSGVEAYARQHPGEGAAAAYLALGHAAMLDHRYDDAVHSYRQANVSGTALDDYADYLGAQAAIQGGHGVDAYGLLDGFAERHPESIFDTGASVLLANAHLQQNDPQGALKVLVPLADSAQGSHVDFRYALARAYQTSGDTAHAASIYRSIYVGFPLSVEAAQARTQLQAMNTPPTAAERKVHADQLFNAKRYAEAGEEYHSIERDSSGLSAADHDALLIYAAASDMRLKKISRREVEKLPDTRDDSAALKLYLLAELSRNEDDQSAHDALIARMVRDFPTSRWLEEALYSGGNMYLLKHDPQQATYHYALLVKLFPKSLYAPSAHWRVAWMNYRQHNYAEAGWLMEEQIQMFGGGIEIPGALYWRGRIYEDEEKNFGQAVNYYRALTASYINSYYAGLARQRLNVLKTQTASVAPAAALSAVHVPVVPDLTGELPENEPHLIKARLLANAALNEYIGPEIQASETSSEWGTLAQAEIYSSYGETTRAIQSMKHSGISFFSLPLDEVPTVYWKLLFPQPYWADLTANSRKNGLDPFLVASLIRQESEFNAGVVSHANAWGLMQLLPSVGKSAAKKQGIKHFDANMLLNPTTNLQLGTLNLREVMDRFGGQAEYALAAYNAGDVPVRQWIAIGDYKDIAEFVESIPYSETREYVQAILRNREIYRALYAAQ
ncbi:transglycosylase SLT domain-containing protein [Tunturibacter empetritectus]|uniref:Soluble lytic murein transglycosylase n=1 Tax=Tunturiibacter empetritectus TaxID=3069691 RepID=A0A7W8MRV3_9BACT|nr:transglycosylase SLT domain-containing protein [Edaphobacter lichenicola]MBB5316559.1 soluble lytic murein transglycosylase [Edaphobacter lichenicola]